MHQKKWQYKYLKNLEIFYFERLNVQMITNENRLIIFRLISVNFTNKL